MRCDGLVGCGDFQLQVGVAQVGPELTLQQGEDFRMGKIPVIAATRDIDREMPTAGSSHPGQGRRAAPHIMLGVGGRNLTDVPREQVLPYRVRLRVPGTTIRQGRSQTRRNSA
jgi:hypothetical protein